MSCTCTLYSFQMHVDLITVNCFLIHVDLFTCTVNCYEFQSHIFMNSCSVTTDLIDSLLLLFRYLCEINCEHC